MDNKMPGFVLDAQRDGREPSADEIYTQTLEWLRERHMDSSVPPSVLQRYAVCSARWLECETQISKFGLLIRSGAIKALSVSMACTCASVMPSFGLMVLT